MLNGYNNELAQDKALHDFFRDQLLSDGHAYKSYGRFIRLLIEVKNEITGISSDPYFQVPMFYRHYLDKLDSDRLLKSAISVMIVIVFGEHQLYLKANLFIGTYLQIMGILVTGTGSFRNHLLRRYRGVIVFF